MEIEHFMSFDPGPEHVCLIVSLMSWSGYWLERRFNA
jgi:hypothetical protein